jgi:hypothetical protein
MQERRNSDRHAVAKLMVKETNGDYFFTFRARDISEDGLFLENKFCVSGQEPFSRLTFTLPNGKQLRNIAARIVREVKRGEHVGCGFEFLNMTEEQRIDLKRFFVDHFLCGTA